MGLSRFCPSQFRRLPQFWRQESRLAHVLTPLSWVWRGAGAARHFITRPRQGQAPVICVGNITVGGTGKTPVVIDIARYVRTLGHTPHILGRGYGGRARGPVRVDPQQHRAEYVGDEALLLAQIAPVWVGARRQDSAAQAERAGANLLILDDGHQNPSLKKDLSLVVVDGNFGFGNGHVIPAGPLREPAATGLARADAVIIIGPYKTGIADQTRTPVFHARLTPRASDKKRLRGRPVHAFCGIGLPDKFYTTLTDMACKVMAFHTFADHHPYRHREIEPMLAQARRAGVPLVTTHKDAVRLPQDLKSCVHVLHVDITWREPDRWHQFLDTALPGLQGKT